MAKEYVTNHGDNSDYKIDWNKVDFSVQSSKRDLNTLDSDYAIDHEIYCDYYGEQVGYLHFSEYENVNANKVHPSLPNKNYEQLLYINNILVNAEFRGWGFGSHIYDKFGEIYKEEFQGWPVAQVFVNPVAEYTFMKAIDRETIPKSALVKELITRDYDENEKQQVKDLFKWLPHDEQKDFNEEMKQLKQEGALNKMAENAVDARNLQIDFTTSDWYVNGSKGSKTNKISATLSNGERIGFVDFMSYELVSEKILFEDGDTYTFIENVIYIKKVAVYQKFQNNGLGLELYKKFGEIYSDNFSGWSVAREFINPIAEYLFRKAVSLGYVPETALNEELIRRDYDDVKQNLAQDLRGKLPEDAKGPEQWAIRKDYRMKKQSRTDLRNRSVKAMKKTRLKKVALDKMEQVQSQTQIEYDGQPGAGDHRIQALLNGEEIGYLTFTEKENNTLSIDDGKIIPEYESYDIEEMILDRFGSIIEHDYPNFNVEPHFNSPEFERAYRSLVSQGLIPASALDNNNVTRNYDDESQMRWEDYKDTLPDHVKAKKLSKLRKYS